MPRIGLFSQVNPPGGKILYEADKQPAVTMLKISKASLCLCLLTVLESTVFLGTRSEAKVTGFGEYLRQLFAFVPGSRFRF